MSTDNELNLIIDGHRVLAMATDALDIHPFAEAAVQYDVPEKALTRAWRNLVHADYSRPGFVVHDRVVLRWGAPVHLSER